MCVYIHLLNGTVVLLFLRFFDDFQDCAVANVTVICNEDAASVFGQILTKYVVYEMYIVLDSSQTGPDEPPAGRVRSGLINTVKVFLLEGINIRGLNTNNIVYT